MKFFHNKTIDVTSEKYEHVLSEKKKLLKSVDILLRKLDITYVISHGNLIEYERNKPIYHDDDIDIRIKDEDMEKLNKYAGNFILERELNIMIFSSLDRTTFYKVQTCGVSKFNIGICVDIVTNLDTYSDFILYDIDFNNLREIEYLDVKTFAPSKEDTERLLAKEYGKDWIIPNYPEYTPN